MRVIVTDDEVLALEDSYEAVLAVMPDADVIPCETVYDAIKAAEEPVDIAFLDVEMPGMTGIELAAKLQEKYPKINIIFVTAFPQYALQAYNLLASSYCVKPITVAEIQKAVDNLRYSLDEIREIVKPVTGKLKAICFGDFSIDDIHGTPIMFRREKSKELLAYLISKNGVEATPTELCDVLWGDDSDNKLDYFWKLTSELRKALIDAGGEEVLRQGRGKYAIDRDKLDCDFLQYLDKTYRNPWNGKFCEQYGGWAEVTKAAILNKKI